ncbi:uncharacterized protein LOC110608464 isoform X2 [Manihot esculenta]|uniref:uncharacterized protein LOC110608464 isoform X2 n=1 Tax=Manihot esculenta TaxID=3983 RepID=UPI001CC60D04|nr:uncharacterized protein LOC110608464 isoform X2 [Manihot esculenta]
MAMMSSSTWRLTRGQEIFSVFPSFAFPLLSTSRRRIERVGACKTNMSERKTKKANLRAAKRERILLPICDDGYRISEFLSHPFGIQAMLNTKTLQSFESLDANTYRCYLPKLQLLNFEAAPVMDLRVTPTEEDCTVEMLSCKFEGSELMERQNDHFSAFMVNRVTWNTTDSEPFLEADMKLNVILEIFTAPFTLLPTSAVEGPGNFDMNIYLCTSTAREEIIGTSMV